MTDSPCFNILHERVLQLTVALYRVTDYFPKAEVLRNLIRSKGMEIYERVMECGSIDEYEKEIDTILQKIYTVKGYFAIASTLGYVRPINFAILEKEYDAVVGFLESEKTAIAVDPVHQEIRSLEQSAPIQHLAEEHAAVNGHKRERPLHNHIFSPVCENQGGYQVHILKQSDTLPVQPEGNPVNPALDPTLARKGGVDYRALNPAASPESYAATPQQGREAFKSGVNERQRIIMDKLRESRRAKISDFFTSFKGISSKTIQRDLQDLCDKRILKKEGDKRWTVYSISEI